MSENGHKNDGAMNRSRCNSKSPSGSTTNYSRESHGRRKPLVNYTTSDSSVSESSDYYYTTSDQHRHSRSRTYSSSRSKSYDERDKCKNKRHRSSHRDDGEAYNRSRSNMKNSPKTPTNSSSSPVIPLEVYKHLSSSLVEETNSKNAAKIAEATQSLPLLLNKHGTDKTSENEMPTSTSKNENLADVVQLLLEQTTKARQLSIPTASNTVFENSCVIKSTKDGFEIRFNTNEKRIMSNNDDERKTITKVTKPDTNVEINANAFVRKDHLNSSNAYKIAMVSEDVNLEVPHVNAKSVVQCPSTITSSSILEDTKYKADNEIKFNPFQQATLNNLHSDNLLKGNHLINVGYLNSSPSFKPKPCKDIFGHENQEKDLKMKNTFSKHENFIKSEPIAKTKKQINLFEETAEDYFKDVFLLSKNTSTSERIIDNLFETEEMQETKNLPPENVNSDIFENCKSNVIDQSTDLFETDSVKSEINIFGSPPKSEIPPENSAPPNPPSEKLKCNSPKSDNIVIQSPPFHYFNYCVIPNSSAGAEVPYTVIDLSVPPPPFVNYNPVDHTEPLTNNLFENIISVPTEHNITATPIANVQIHESVSQTCNKRSSSKEKFHNNQDHCFQQQTSLQAVVDGSDCTSSIEKKRKSMKQSNPPSQHYATRELSMSHVRQPRSKSFNKNKVYIVPSKRTVVDHQDTCRAGGNCSTLSSPAKIFCIENWDDRKVTEHDMNVYQSPSLSHLHDSSIKTNSKRHLPTIIHQANMIEVNKNAESQMMKMKQVSVNNQVNDEDVRRKLPRFTPVRAPALTSKPRNVISYVKLFPDPEIKDSSCHTPSKIKQHEAIHPPSSIHTNSSQEWKGNMQTDVSKTSHTIDLIKIESFQSSKDKCTKPTKKIIKKEKINKKKQKVQKLTCELNSVNKSLKKLTSKALPSQSTMQQISVESEIKITPLLNKKAEKQLQTKLHTNNKSKICVIPETSVPMLTRSRKKLIESICKTPDLQISGVENVVSLEGPRDAIINKHTPILTTNKKKSSSKKERKCVSNKQKALVVSGNVSQLCVKTKAELKYYPPELNCNYNINHFSA